MLFLNREQKRMMMNVVASPVKMANRFNGPSCNGIQPKMSIIIRPAITIANAVLGFLMQNTIVATPSIKIAGMAIIFDVNKNTLAPNKINAVVMIKGLYFVIC